MKRERRGGACLALPGQWGHDCEFTGIRSYLFPLEVKQAAAVKPNNCAAL